MAGSAFDIAVERPILAAAVNLLLIALGLAALFILPVREYPNIDPPTVSVRTQYVGAPAEVVETQITKVIEDNLSGISGVRLIRSTSRNEASSINIEFVAGTDIDGAAADVRDKVSAVRADLPQDVEEPVIEKANADDQPMIWITLRSSELAPPELTDVAERLISDAIGIVPGVARIQVGGEKRYAMRIWLDRRAMAARGITASDVVARLEAENVELPAGRLETGMQEIALRAETRFETAAQFAALVLRDVQGDRVTVGDVAEVEVGVEEYRTAFRASGEEAVALGVVRQSNANTLEVASGVRAEIERIRGRVPGDVQLEVEYDESIFISETLRNVSTTLAQVVAIIVLVTWLSLGSWRATLIPAAAIPASIIPAFAVAAALGFSINVLTILAVILAISLTTDDAVVIVENVRRRQQQGEPMPLGAMRATRQVGFATFASAAVLIAVILPLGFIAGNVGQLFREFAVVLATIVALSTFAVVTLAPMLASKLFRKQVEPGRLARWVEGRLERLGQGYRRLLERAIARPVLPIGAAVVLLGLGAVAFLGLSSEVAPEEDRGALRIRIEAPEGSSYEYTSAKVREIEQVLQKYVAPAGGAGDGGGDGERGPRPVESVLSIITPGYGGSIETNIAFIIVRLIDWSERDISQAEFQQRLQRDIAPITGVRAVATAGPSLGQRRGGQQLQFVVRGIERPEVQQWAETLLERSAEIEGLQNAELDYRNTKPQISVTVERSRAAALGVSAAAIGEALQVMFGSLQVTRYVDRGEEYDVVLQAKADDRSAPQDLRNVYVRSLAGDQALVPLSAVVRLDEESTARELGRLDRLAAITLESSLAPGLSLGDALEQLDRIAAEVLPGQAQVSYLGEARDLQETGGSIYPILALVLVLVYFVLAGQFESFLHPLIIMTSAPLAIAGGVVTMWMLQLTINIYTQISLILLVGLVAKNAILLVEFANQLRDQGRDPRAAAVEAAGIRLRPILMTSVAAVLGAVPLMLESGAGAEARRTLGLVTASGLLVGTLLTLFLVPTLYALLGRFSREPGKVREELQAQQREHPDDDQHAGPGEDRPAPAGEAT